MLKYAFDHQGEILAEALKEGKGLTFKCSCGAGLKQIPLEKVNCVFRRRCPECKQRWKLTVLKDVELVKKGFTTSAIVEYAARFQKMGHKSAKPKKKIFHKNLKSGMDKNKKI